MTVVEPTFPTCPGCGGVEYDTEARINIHIQSDGMDGISIIDPVLDSIGSFERVECADCGHVLIEDGEIMDDAVTGMEI